MKSVCSNCDLGLKRSDCTDLDYISCECRRWTIELLKNKTVFGFMSTLNEALELVFENEKDLNRNKAQIINILSKELMG